MRNQEELLKKKKKGRSRFGRFVLTLILVIVFLVLAFYFLNNPSAYAGFKSKFTSIFLSESSDKSSSGSDMLNSEFAASDGSSGISTEADNAATATNIGNGNTYSEITDANGQSSTESVSQSGEDSSGNVSQNTGSIAGTAQSFWQKIIAFFRQKISGQADNFPGTVNAKIYFAALGQDEVFSYEERQISAGNPRVAVENVVIELLKGPSKSFHYPVIPPGTKLLGIQIYENLAKIDFSQEFLENSLESGILDDYVIYTIVDTVTQIPGVEGVIFLIDGKRIKLYGSVDLSIPAIKNEKYLPVETGESGESS